MISTIIFDFGGVLGTDSDPIFYKALAKYGIPKKEAMYIWNKHWPKMKIDDERVDEIWKTTEEYTASNIEKISIEYINLISVDQKMINLCNELKQKGYKLGMLANETYDWMNIKRQKGNLEEIFDVVYSSADIKLAKPSSESYLKTLEGLKAKPEETLFIDNLSRNTEAAEKLGIKSIIFEDISQLKKELKKLNLI